MSIPYLSKHLGEYLKELVGVHSGIDAVAIAGAHLVPVEPVGLTLIVEEAVMLVHYLPQSLEIAFGGIVVFVNIHA